LYRAALGPAHADRYLPVFSRFDARGANGPAWNTAAALGNLGWLVYRQLWGAAGEFAAALGVWALIAAGLAFWADFLPTGVRMGLALALLLLLLLVPGVYGTALLHAQVVRRMIAAVRQATTMEEACTLLRQQSDAHRRRSAWGMAVLLLVALIAGGVWMAWPTQPVPPASPVLPVLPPVVSSPIPIPTPVPVPVPDLARAKASVAGVSAPVEVPIKAPPVAAVMLSATSAEPVPPTVAAAPPAETRRVPVAQTVGLADTRAQATAAPKQPVIETALRGKEHGVSVGLFGVPENAERIQAKLAAAGLPVLKDPIESANGPLTRVRVGPFERLEQAQAAAARVRALGLDARVYAP
jgi:cell division septation protein DedD